MNLADSKKLVMIMAAHNLITYYLEENTWIFI